MIYFRCEKCNSVIHEMELDEETQHFTLKELAALAKRMICPYCIIQAIKKESDENHSR